MESNFQQVPRKERRIIIGEPSGSFMPSKQIKELTVTSPLSTHKKTRLITWIITLVIVTIFIGGAGVIANNASIKKTTPVVHNTYLKVAEVKR